MLPVEKIIFLSGGERLFVKTLLKMQTGAVVVVHRE